LVRFGVGVIAVFLHAMVDYPFSRPALAAWAVVMIALLATRTNPVAAEFEDR
jgi:ABC-type glycerol-3-phosphate transport system permease component